MREKHSESACALGHAGTLARALLRILCAAVAALALGLSAGGFSAVFAVTTANGALTCTLNGNIAVITDCDESAADAQVSEAFRELAAAGYTIAVIGERAFAGCGGLTSIDIPDSVTAIGAYAFSDCGGLTSIDIPDGATSIGERAFARTGIEKITVPASAMPTGSDAAADPFADMPRLRAIVFSHGRTSLPTHILRGIFSNPAEIYVPASVISAYPKIELPSSANMRIRSVAGSYIEGWAGETGIAFESIRARIKEGECDEAHRFVPYSYVIRTSVPGNENLSFKVVGGSLPAGLSLLQDGRFRGAPLETGAFTFDVALRFTLFGEEDAYILDLRKLSLTVTEPTDTALAAANDYVVHAFIGEPAEPGTAGAYVLRGSRDAGGLADQSFEVADSFEDILRNQSNYSHFADFWLDGRRLTRGPVTDPSAEYDARDGSTIVTVYAKTFQNLDNGAHTAAAAFLVPDPDGGPGTQKIAAQKFTLELTGGPLSETPQTRGRAFDDVRAGDWFYDDVARVCESGLMNGTSAALFSPHAPMTRGMLVTVLGRFCGADESVYAVSGFGDVPAGRYYTAYVAWAAENGIVAGVGGGAFAPNAHISRQDLATLLLRCADFTGRELPAARSGVAFADAARTAGYARAAVNALAAAGIVNGKSGGNFDPQGRATRAEVAAILHRFIKATD
ncbi:MAG: S-layer homology domain-containing protein [Clostridiales Family XIII bacterium]|jgi:hypothetical protein|nr:S-layer homology domain-containing protein [Clostridiales Family XIII bacterium]